MNPIFTMIIHKTWNALSKTKKNRHFPDIPGWISVFISSNIFVQSCEIHQSNTISILCQASPPHTESPISWFLKPNFLYISTLSGRQVRINFFLPFVADPSQNTDANERNNTYLERFANDDMAFSGYRVYEKRGHKVGKDLYEAKNTTRALSVELKMVARSATISDCRQTWCWVLCPAPIFF